MTNNGTYYFTNVDGKYVSNNKNRSGSLAKSYIRIDLTNVTDSYELKVNASISSELDHDFGYVVVSTSSIAPSYSNSGVSGTSTETRDYAFTLNGGRVYYLHFGYRKDSSGNDGDDCFTINSVEINPMKNYTFTATTNEEGIAVIGVEEYGTYTLKEVEAPEHYSKSDIEETVEISAGDSIHNYEFTNIIKSKVVVHHYLKGTTNKVAEDDILEGAIGDQYEVKPHIDLEKLTYINENPDSINLTGEFEEQGKEYILYYEPEQIQLTIHHYYDGTETKLVEDEIINTEANIVFTGEAQYEVSANASYEIKENGNYKTLINDNEFVNVYSTAKTGTSIDDTIEYNTDTEITYYYKLRAYNYKVQYFYSGVLDESKTDTFSALYDTVVESYIDKNVMVLESYAYKIEKVKALDENGEEAEMPLSIKSMKRIIL